MDEIDRLFKRIIAEPVKACVGHKPVVELRAGRPYWRCILCDKVWPMLTGKREEAQ